MPLEAGAIWFCAVHVPFITAFAMFTNIGPQLKATPDSQYLGANFCAAAEW